MANTPRTSGVFSLGALGSDTAASGDADWSNVTLLLRGDNSTLEDKSGSTHTNYLSWSGTPTYGTGKYGGAFYFSDASRYLNGPTTLETNDFQFGTGDFTIESWVYLPSGSNFNTGDKCLFETRGYGTGGWVWFFTGTGNNSIVQNYYISGAPVYATSNHLSPDTWHHVALVRSGSNITFWRDGVASTGGASNVGSTDFSQGTGNGFHIGQRYDAVATTSLTGLVDDFRITTGVARDIAADWAAGVYNSALPQGAAVAATTRPTRRWGGMTGRSLTASTVVTAPWTPADITSATVVGWFDGENVNGGTSGNSNATSWVNQISGQNDLSFTGSPTVGTDNVRTISGSYLTETGTASFQQTADWRVFVAATIKGGSGADAYYPLVTHAAGTIDTGAYIFWRGGTSFASYPNYNNVGGGAWGNFDNYTPGYSKTFQNSPGVYDFTASTSSPWEVSFDGGRDIKAGPATYTTQIGSGRPMIFGWGRVNSRRLDAEYHQIVVIQGTLSSGDEEKLYGYLAHKAGSQGDLPLSHPYQSAAPTKTSAGATNVPTTGVLSLAEHYQSKL